MNLNIQFYRNDDELISGITLKDVTQPENNNMALHCCDDANAILKNRQQLADALAIDLQKIVCANQTHSANVYKVTADDFGRGATSVDTAIPNTDALYTFEKGVALCTFTADCVPVSIYEPESGLIAVIYSGWQGTVKEISKHVMETLIQKEQIDPKKLQIHIGTALSQEKFEVDEDVYLKFKALGYADDFMYFNDTTRKYHIDNQKTVQMQFELAGVPTSQITIDSSCTFKKEQGFSYRQNRAGGRHLTFLMQK